MTPAVLATALGCPLARATKWAAPITDALAACGISTPARIAAWLAQIGHESGRLRYVREIWEPTPAQSRYEGRADLGNTEPGDGYKYRGRGLIQITGRANYRALGIALGAPFELRPELLERPDYAALSAAHYWQSRDINELADAGEFDAICDLINRGHKTRKVGDANGYADRLALWARAKSALGISEHAA